MANMARTLKIIGSFAAIGFIVPLLLLVSHDISRTVAGNFAFRVCPACLISSALDGARGAIGVITWLLICISNAVLYAIPGAIVAFVVHITTSR